MIESVFKHIDAAIDSLLDICDQLSEEELAMTPIEGKRSLGELLSHMSLICRADLYISEGASLAQMQSFYETNSPHTIDEIKKAFLHNRRYLHLRYCRFTTEDLLKVTESYWGASYSRLEWLLEIMGHLYHHRGQLYTMLALTSKEQKVAVLQ